MSDLSMIREKIVDTLRAVEPNLADTRLTDATTLADLKLDSLRLIELGVLLEDNFGKGVHFDQWLEQERGRGGTTAYSLESLIAFISKTARA
ncbi:MAG: acyl carrier protein [Sulfurifustaceae bacterium]